MKKSKLKLSPQLSAALASGGVTADEVEAADEPGNTASAADKEGQEEEVTTPAPEANTPAPEAATPTPAPITTAAADNALVAHLKDELKEQRNEVSRLSLELSNTKTKLTEAEGTIPSLQKIVLTATERLAVALNVSTADLASLSPAALADRFTVLNADFAKKFKVGAQSTPAAENTPNASSVVQLDPRRTAAVGATQLKAK